GGVGGSPPGLPVVTWIIADCPMRLPLPLVTASSKVANPPPQARTRNWAWAPPAVSGPVARVPSAKTPGTGVPTLVAAPSWMKLFEPRADQYKAALTLSASVTGFPVTLLV